MNVIGLFNLSPSKLAIARMAMTCESEATHRLCRGDHAGAEGRFRAADSYWSAALDFVGKDGWLLDKRVGR